MKRFVPESLCCDEMKEMSGPIRVFIERLDRSYLARIQEGLSYIGMASKVKPGDTVFIKPNLTYPYYKEGVMTSPGCVEQLIQALKDYSLNIIVGEADGGGYNRFSMDEVFEKTGLRVIAKRHNVKLVNLSKLSSRDIYFDYKGQHFVVPLPRLLLDEIDLFITVPVPKVHGNTGVSMSIKNQWGCIQEPSLRLKLHPYFKKIILEVNKALKVGISIIDGKFGLTRNGPLRGDAVELNWITVADNILAADMVCCHLIGIDPLSIRYLHYYAENGPPVHLDEILFYRDYTRFVGPRFELKREWLDYPGYLAFYSSFFAHVAYHSSLSRALHKGLYLFREKFYDHD